MSLVCLSEHEGFCVPVVEAMALGVPVVAYAAAAIPDTQSVTPPCCSRARDPLLVACAVDRLVTDRLLRDELVAAGRARAEHFSLPNTAKQLVAQIGRVGRCTIGRHDRSLPARPLVCSCAAGGTRCALAGPVPPQCC